VDQTELAQVSAQWRIFANTVMNYWIPKKRLIS